MDITLIENKQLPLNFTSRPLSVDDAGQAVDLYNTYSQAYLGYNTDSLEDDLVYWQTPEFNLNTDTCVVYNGQGKMIGVAEFWDIVDPHIRFNIGIVVHPDFENLGIGSYLYAWAEQRAQSAMAFSPSGAQVVIQQGVDSRLKKSIAFLQNHGFNKVRDFYHMHIDLAQEPAVPMIPKGWTIRPFQGEVEMRGMFRALWEAFKDHWGFIDEPFEKFLDRWQHWGENMKSIDPSLLYVAIKDGDIAGACMCMSERPEDPDIGWVNMLGVRRQYRNNGLGLAFLQVAFAEFYRRGKKRSGLGVDASNLTGALALYEKAGMHVAQLQHSYQKVLQEGVDLSTRELPR